MTAKNILIVDDEPDLRATLKDIFEISGYSVVTAGNGEEALSLLQQGESPCLLLLDLMMPVMNGWEFLGRLSEERPQTFDAVPIVVISAVADTVDLGQRYPCEVMKKPLNIPHLLTLAGRHCTLRSG